MADTDHRSPEEIEREIAQERVALTRTLDEIQDRLSWEGLSGQMMGSLREHGGDIGRSVSRSVKDNPIPLALTALGLAWLAISSNRSGRADDDRDYEHTRRDYSRFRRDPLDERVGATVTGLDGRTSEPAERPGAGTGPVGSPRPVYDASGRALTTHSYGDDDDDDGESRWDRTRRAVSGAADRAGERLHEGRDAASGAADRAREHAASTSSRARSGMARTRQGARQRAQGAYASAEELRDRIAHGTRDLSEGARARVLSARARAYEAQLRAEHLASRGRDKAVDLYEDQPLIGGAVALAIGAALGAALPGTRREDEMFGSYRDQLFEEAEEVYREERAKLEEVARATGEEAKVKARETAEDLKETARDSLSEAERKTKDAARDVAETAREEADKKDLGKPS